jgi:uncharacterized surface protein with fasciclin (FAS1) repeats
MTNTAVLQRPSAAEPLDGSESPDGFNGAGRRSATSAHDHDILTTAEGSNRLGVFVDFMRAAGLSGLLLGEGPFTVFAPSDRAFQKLSLRERDALLADRRRLGEVMRGHVVAGRMTPPTISMPTPATTVDGRTLVLSTSGGDLHVGKARLVQTSIPASNGTIHVIDSILMYS